MDSRRYRRGDEDIVIEYRSDVGVGGVVRIVVGECERDDRGVFV